MSLALEHLEMATITARKYFKVLRYTPGLEIEDLEQEGAFGLLQAESRYDPTRGMTFKTFALPRVRGAVVDALHEGFPYGDQQWGDMNAYWGMEQKLLAETGHSIALSEVVASMDLDPAREEKLLAIILSGGHAGSLDMPMGAAASSTSMDQLPDPQGGVEEAAADDLFKHDFAGAISDLPEDLAAIMHDFYIEGKTQAEIGAAMINGKHGRPVKQARVSRIIGAGLLQLDQEFVHSLRG